MEPERCGDPAAREAGVTAIERVAIVPDADAGTVALAASLTGAAKGCTLRPVASADGKAVATAEGAAGGPIRLRIPNPRLWSPAHPFLYDLTIALHNGAT